MAQNISDEERVLRVVLGIYAMLLGFLFIQGVVGIVLGVIGVIALATGALGFCGVYVLLGREPVEAEVESEAPEDEGVTDAD